MIFYHGLPITPLEVALKLVKNKHVMVPFPNNTQLRYLENRVTGFTFDNGAFTIWKTGKQYDFEKYYTLVDDWRAHPAFDWAIIPDVIDGDLKRNIELIETWPFPKSIGVPVYHLHEPIQHLKDLCHNWDRVALGSSGTYANPGTQNWFNRMTEMFNAICEDGYPKAKIHGLRMMAPEICGYFPFASVDSTMVAHSIGIDNKWSGSMAPPTRVSRGVVLIERIEDREISTRWDNQVLWQQNLL